jgi:hypothetical protein
MSKSESPLCYLSPRGKPRISTLLADVKAELLNAQHEDIFERMRKNHEARHTIWDLKTGNCRKPSREDLKELGMKPESIFPHPGAADHEVKLVDGLIREHTDMLTAARDDAPCNIFPAGLDVTDDRRMKLAEELGQMRDYYREQSELDIADAEAQWLDHAWEYGHGIAMVDWHEKQRATRHEITPEQMRQLIARASIDAIEAQRRQDYGLPEDYTPPEDEPLISEEEEALILQDAERAFEEAKLDANVRDRLTPLIMALDPRMSEPEAARVAKALKSKEPAHYYIPEVIKAAPRPVAYRSGVNVFFPASTTRIRNAQFIVVVEHLLEWELWAKTVEANPSERWDKKAVKALVDRGTKDGNLFGLDLPDWVMQGVSVGAEIDENDLRTRYRVLRIYYTSNAMGGVPALYCTICAEDMDTPLWHVCAEDWHGEYPFVDYVREPDSATLWGSRGVGEIAFSEQEEERDQVNYISDNAKLTIKPPLNVPGNNEGKKFHLEPGFQYPVRRAGEGSGITRIDVGGNAGNAVESMKAAMERTKRYWLTGADADPVARRNRWRVLSKYWGLSCKALEKLTLATIQQHISEGLSIRAIGGNSASATLTREEITQELSVGIYLDSDALDPEAVENRLKMFVNYISILDKEDLVDNFDILRLSVMSINPRWVNMVKPRDRATREEQEDIVRILTAAAAGVETPYVIGKNHASRAQMIQQILSAPATDDAGNPIVDETTGQPLTNRLARIAEESPDVAAIIDRRLKFETTQASQVKNKQIGRLGVQPEQPTATP